MEVLSELKQKIASYEDFPQKGVIFRDIFSLMREPDLFSKLNSLLIQYVKENCDSVDAVVGLDSRGFIFATVLSIELKIPFIPIRKAGKLPGEVLKKSYTLEYGSSNFEIQKDSLTNVKNVIVVDDLLATGGTMKAAIELLNDVGVNIIKCITIIELEELQGSKILTGTPFHSFIKY